MVFGEDLLVGEGLEGLLEFPFYGADYVIERNGLVVELGLSSRLLARLCLQLGQYLLTKLL